MPDDIWKWIGEHKDQIMALCAIVTTICANGLAIYGVNKWRTEVLGKARLQAAQDVLRALYRVREAFKHVRSQMIYMHEYPKEMADGFGHLKNEHRAEGTRYVYAKRLEKLDEAFRVLENQHIEAQVLHGKEIHDDIVPIRKCRVEVVIAIQELCESYASPREDRRATREERTARDQKIYHMESSSPHGAFTREIESALDKYEKKFRKLIGTHGG